MVLFISAMVLFSSQTLTPALAMALHALAAFVAFVVGAVLLLRALPNPVRAATPTYNTRVWLASALPLSFIAGMQIINNQTDIVMLGLFTTAEDVGVYRIAAHGAHLVAFTLGAINMVISPHIARLYKAGDHERLQHMLTWSARLILASALPVALAFTLFGEQILGFLFGSEFTGGYWALVILCAGQLINAAMGSVAFILNMTGHERDSAWGISAAAGVNVLLNLALIPSFGIEGAATATAASLAIWNIILARRVFQRTGLVSTAIGRVSREKPA
jgi:O-antigen/teichoic acid export membrane protein